MRRRTWTPLILGAAVVPIAVAATSAGAVAPRARHADHGLLRPTVHGQTLPTRNDSVSSLNWSGYATAPGSGVTGVASTFTVPSAASLPPGFSANWAGIGGYNTQDLIQAGTAENSSGLLFDQYYAWFEILPDSETQLTNCSGDSACTVRPGDEVSVDIHQISNNVWSVSLTDAGRWSWQQNVPYVSTHSSAEWIYEAPTVAVQTIPADTGTSYFGPTSTFTNVSGTHTIAAGNPVSISMGAGLVNEATPSALASNGQSFNVCAYQQSCPAPSS